METPNREGQDHIPVLLDEVLGTIVRSDSGTYVDASYGRGGHSRALLAQLSGRGRVIAFDRDPEAVAEGQRNAAAEPRLAVRHGLFSELGERLSEMGVDEVDGVLLDVGVSSPQLDQSERGFSFQHDGPLDMRMDPGSDPSAAQWLNHAREADIARVLKDFGEERYARRIARAIVAARPLNRTADLAAVVADAVPGGAAQKHPATRTFQAIRIFVNQEFAELDSGIDAAFGVLAVHGRLAVISFHSLEDRLVKRKFRSLTQADNLPRRLPVASQALVARARAVAGPVRPSAAEVARNPRARSATLRVVERLEPRRAARG